VALPVYLRAPIQITGNVFMFSTLSARLCVLAALLICAAVCKANQLRETELAQRVADADLVVVGTVEELLECGARQGGECSPHSATAVVMVSDVLKGVPPSELLFRCNEPMVESSPGACHPGRKYLLFLRADGNGVFHSVNGPYGAIDVGKGWLNGAEPEPECT